MNEDRGYLFQQSAASIQFGRGSSHGNDLMIHAQTTRDFPCLKLPFIASKTAAGLENTAMPFTPPHWMCRRILKWEMKMSFKKIEV
ncbi:hypothetical protein AAHA92_23292 [Salvia divinorum]|uniref:Uncharacterized protein n=1 Tax=Salvia divinorum TaxID=28513 RepID=A0ABD1GRH5_SALDI